MSRRLLAALAVLVAAGLIFHFWPQADQPPEPTPAVVPVAAIVVSPTPPTLPPVPVVAPPFDAGVSTGLLTIALVREGKPEIGPRLTVRNAQGEEASRPTDVMGLATFELPLGWWLVTAPPELKGQSVEVTSEPGRVTWSLSALRRVEGEVLDEQGSPVAGVPITVQPPRVGRRDGLGRFTLIEGDESPPVEAAGEQGKEVARSDTGGRFSFLTLEESLELVATRGGTLARKQVVPPASGVKLRLEQLAVLSVMAPQGAKTLLSLSSRYETVVHQVSGLTELRVPVGELDARALAILRGKLQRASHRVVVKADQPDVLRLDFSPAAPITGVVQDAAGRGLPGVEMGLTLAPGTQPRTQELTLTDALGHFEVRPRIIRGGDPVYEVHLMPPWHELHPVLVRLGDAPLLIEAEPAPAAP